MSFQKENSIVDLQIDKVKNVAIMTFNQAVINIKFIREVNKQLDLLEKIEGPMCLITTCSKKNIYSAGLDFKIFRQKSYDDIHNVLTEATRLITRFMILPFPTIACINGHCLAAGFMLAMSHDLRIIQNSKQIKLGMPEINLGMNIPQDMIAVLQAKIENRTLEKICQEGLILCPQQAYQLKVIDNIVNQKELKNECIRFGEKLSPIGQNRLACKGIKTTLYIKYIQRAEGAAPDQISKILAKTFKAKL